MSDDTTRGGSEPTAARFQYDWAVDSPTTAIAESVAAASGRDPLDLDALQHYVDSDALDTLFADPGATVRVDLTYDGHEVSVFGDGTVTVRAAGD